MATYETIRPAGNLVVLANRPCDVFERDGQFWVKENGHIEVFDASGKSIGTAASEGGASQIGLVESPKGALFSNAGRLIHEFGFVKGKLSHLRDFTLPDGSFPTGIAWLNPGRTFLTCLSIKDKLVEVDYASGKILKEWKTDAAPYQVRVIDDNAIVSVDSINLKTGERTICNVGLQPGATAYLKKSKLLIVANANDDSIDVLDVQSFKSIKRFGITIDPKLPFGSMPNGLAVSSDEKRLYVSLAGNNADEVLDISTPKDPKLLGYIPTAWYPSALSITDNKLAILSAQGIGSRTVRRPAAMGRNSWDITGAIQFIDSGDLSNLRNFTVAAVRAAKTRDMLLANRVSYSQDADPVPVPKRIGEPSVFEHVIYVIKENRTYDQVFGDIATGDGDPKLCTFGERVTPNQHAIARQFSLLDNYYCSGVCSADGHAWALEGNVTPYLTQEFGQGARSYDFGTDPISYSKSGFIWDALLAKGYTFRNFGELDFPSLPDGWKLNDVWRAYEKGNHTVFGQRVEIDRLRKYTARDYPGWEMAIPDVLRMDRFLSEFREWEKSGTMPNFVIVYLPQDHTAGLNPGYPKPESYVADNDLALGRLVDALSHSKFWKDTVLFANEDDPQAGYDHIDGHRSTCIVASAYTKHAQTVSEFYNQDSVLHTILRIFGCEALNQKIAVAPLMTKCFNNVPDLAPFNAIDPIVDRKAVTPPISQLRGEQRRLAVASMGMNLRHPDSLTSGQDDLMNRALWASVRGDQPYPIKYAGGHGRGLKAKGLKRDNDVKDDD